MAVIIFQQILSKISEVDGIFDGTLKELYGPKRWEKLSSGTRITVGQLVHGAVKNDAIPRVKGCRKLSNNSFRYRIK